MRWLPHRRRLVRAPAESTAARPVPRQALLVSSPAPGVWWPASSSGRACQAGGLPATRLVSSVRPSTPPRPGDLPACGITGVPRPGDFPALRPSRQVSGRPRPPGWACQAHRGLSRPRSLPPCGPASPGRPGSALTGWFGPSGPAAFRQFRRAPAPPMRPVSPGFPAVLSPGGYRCQFRRAPHPPFGPVSPGWPGQFRRAPPCGLTTAARPHPRCGPASPGVPRCMDADLVMRAWAGTPT